MVFSTKKMLSCILYIIFLDSINSSNSALLTELSELPLDSEQRLDDHFLLYSGNDECVGEILQTERESRFRVFKEVEGSLKSLFFGNNINDCAIVCLERGVYIDQLLSPIPAQLRTDLQPADVTDWVLTNCQAAELGFLSYHANNLNIYWIEPITKNRTYLHQIGPGEKHTSWHNSFLGHQFELNDAVTDELIGSYTVEYNGIIPIGTPPPQTLEIDPTNIIKSTLHSEWGKSHQVKRTFTELGFSKGRLPDDLWGSISAYYYNNRYHKVQEEWMAKGLFVNWWEKDVFFIPMPWKLKRYWQSCLKTLVEAWSGVELELTDIYGMRRYEEGARLLTHVDRIHTHAASLIINVAQANIRKPWTVEIYDFADRLHEVVMDEGDIVYYESARCLHGRMQPLEGEYYVNLFAHYRPIGDPHWYDKENPANAPEHLIDIGECQSDGTAANCSKHSDIIKFLSPKLETLHGPDDLFKFWKTVSPVNGATSDSLKEEL